MIKIVERVNACCDGQCVAVSSPSGHGAWVEKDEAGDGVVASVTHDNHLNLLAIFDLGEISE